MQSLVVISLKEDVITVRYFIYLIVTTKEKPVVNTHKIKRKKSKHTTTKIHEIRKRGRNYKKVRKLQKSLKRKNKMVIVSPYLSIMTLKNKWIKVSNQKTETGRMIERTRSTYLLPTKDLFKL